MSVHPVIQCPITGEEVRVVEVKVGPPDRTAYMGVVTAKAGGYSTRIFDHRTQLEDFFRMRNGKMAKPAPAGRVEIVGVREPPVDTSSSPEEKQVERDADEIAQAGVARIVRGLR